MKVYDFFTKSPINFSHTCNNEILKIDQERKAEVEQQHQSLDRQWEHEEARVVQEAVERDIVDVGCMAVENELTVHWIRDILQYLRKDLLL